MGERDLPPPAAFTALSMARLARPSQARSPGRVRDTVAESAGLLLTSCSSRSGDLVAKATERMVASALDRGEVPVLAA
jgi:hypothetical protein